MITQQYLMTETDARECVRVIKEQLTTAEHHFSQGNRYLILVRQSIWNLHEYQGWKALGYKSWRECVKDQFEKGQSTLYKQLAAAAVETKITPDSPIGTIPERILRPLTKKRFSDQTRETLWEIATKIAGHQSNVTGGLMNAVVETLEQAIVTGTLQDEDGEQSSVFEKVKADVLARTVESSKRHQQYMQQGRAGIKIVSAMDAISNVDGQNNVVLELKGQLSTDQLKNLLNSENKLKVTIWIEGVENDG